LWGNNLESMTIIYNKEEKKELRRTLRQNSTKPEQILWNKLRSKQLGVKFRRQYSVWRYIFDFYCVEKRLCIELDGESHFSDKAREYDAIRTEFLESLWISVLMFINSEVMENMDGVLLQIQDRVTW
jgi:very-short-patch-repair endonuclease